MLTRYVLSVPTKAQGSLPRGATHCTYAIRLPASGVSYVKPYRAPWHPRSARSDRRRGWLRWPLPTRPSPRPPSRPWPHPSPRRGSPPPRLCSRQGRTTSTFAPPSTFLRRRATCLWRLRLRWAQPKRVTWTDTLFPGTYGICALKPYVAIYHIYREKFPFCRRARRCTPTCPPLSRSKA